MTPEEHLMQGLAAGINNVLQEVFPTQMGFMLLVFEFNKPGVSNYVSNGDRQSMIKALREAANVIERGEDIPATVGGVQ